MKISMSVMIAFGLVVCASASVTLAQDVEDLFSLPRMPEARTPEASSSDPIDPAAEARAAALGVASPSALGVASPSALGVASPSALGVASPSDRRLVESNGSQAEKRKSSAMEIRQARALHEAHQRRARLEAARWAGSPTLRPSWNPDPMTASRYPNRNRITIPVFYFHR